MPFNSGSIIAGIILVGAFIYGIKYTRKKNKVHLNTLILSVLFIMVGFSSWLMLPIRANANTTINENNPSSARELLAYYNREQYGDANVFYDTYYSNDGTLEYKKDAYGNDVPVTKDGKPKYEKDLKNNKYVIVNRYKNTVPVYSSKHKGFIPRMVDPSRELEYKRITGIPTEAKRRPTFGENLHFMAYFQFGYMYGRYFMWNFVGRQNDTQGQQGIFNGNWINGIDVVDEFFLGPQQQLPDEVKNNKGRNKYYFLPLILGLIGLLYQVKYDKRNFYTLFLFFVFTGFAVIFYTNPKSFEVRERDYAIVGSFYIFAIWIGFGVFALYQYLKQFGNKKTIAIAVSVVSLLAVPTLMAPENWDDHDRSNRYTTRLNAQAYLESCDPNAIMFTIGDNDTFPLWYMQEVEGIRRDIKLINTSLFATDWYIDQMKRATYEAPPIPSQLTHDKYKTGSLEIAYYKPHPQFQDSIIGIKDLMRWMESDNAVTYHDNGDEKIKTYPTNRIRVPVNKENALKNGIVRAKDADLMVDYIDITINKSYITKNQILMLDILANFNWEQPLYFTGGANDDAEYIWLKDYLQLDGMAYKLVPILTSNKGKTMFDMGRIDTEKMYDNLQKLDWRNINDGKIYIDEQTRKNAISLRNNMLRLAEAFANENNFEKAEEILDSSLDKMPIRDFGHISIALGYPEIYYKIGKVKKARKTLETLIDMIQQRLRWYSTFGDEYLNIVIPEIQNELFMYKQGILDQVNQNDKDKEYVKKLQEDFTNTLSLFSHLMQE
ncbi:MAG: tetratricopeptide repeat protein [Flavobacteriaceae bacterium]|nr:tetratricopeptide repeat protein [Flavobacteriaceae bacterium]